jgi:hypothetical protein
MIVTIEKLNKEYRKLYFPTVYKFTTVLMENDNFFRASQAMLVFRVKKDINDPERSP